MKPKGVCTILIGIGPYNQINIIKLYILIYHQKECSELSTIIGNALFVGFKKKIAFRMLFFPETGTLEELQISFELNNLCLMHPAPNNATKVLKQKQYVT